MCKTDSSDLRGHAGPAHPDRLLERARGLEPNGVGPTPGLWGPGGTGGAAGLNGSLSHS